MSMGRYAIGDRVRDTRWGYGEGVVVGKHDAIPVVRFDDNSAVRLHVNPTHLQPVAPAGLVTVQLTPEQADLLLELAGQVGGA